MVRWQLMLAIVCVLPCLCLAEPSNDPTVALSKTTKKIIRKVKRGENAKLREWDHNNHRVCSGTYNGRTMAGNDRIDDLRNMYENCTRVRGNLEITHLTMETIANSNVTLSEKLKIFQHIEEIKGYLLIYNVDFDVLWFPNLKIIWGDRHFEDVAHSRGAALMISGNHQLKEIHMPKLRTIHSGDVLIENNTYLCYLRDRVNWNELLNMDPKRFIAGHDAFRDCDKYTFTECSPDCASGNCWGKMPAHCQSVYRSHCPQRCGGGIDSFGEHLSPQCYFNGTTSSYECCNSACEGGCTGSLDTDCVACKKLKLNNSCVSSCPEPKIMDKKVNKLVSNPSGTFIDDRYCVKQCSANMLIEGNYCVRHCSDGFFHDANTDSRLCEKCPKEGCPKACEVNAPLTREILPSLKDCEVINGFIKITGPYMQEPATAFTVADLAALRKVRIVSEFVYMVTSTISPTNMSFLENLEVIEGRALDTEKYALVISQNDNLRELGLKKLKKIKAGDVFIRENHSLCFASTINWNSTIMPSTSHPSVVSNMNVDTCIRRKKVCHEECSQKDGCWGQGPKMCVKCAHWKLNEECAKKCPDQGYFEDDDTHECKPCFDKCLTCKGPKKSDCSACKNVALQENNRLVCLDTCGKKHFEQAGACYPCHESCYDHGCTGGSNSLGEGGCNKCRFGLVDELGEVAQCLFTDGPQHNVCVANNFTHHYVISAKMEGVESAYCAECHDACLSCRTAGNGVEHNGCVCKDFEVETSNKRVCDSRCPQFYYEAEHKESGKAGRCRRCADVCDHNAGCWGPGSTDCENCAYAAIMDNDIMTCVDKCPDEKPYNGTESGRIICSEEDIDRIQRRNRNIGITFSLTFGLAIVVLILFIMYKCRRLGRKLEKVRNENLADIPEEIPMASARPNLNRVYLITRNELHNKSIKLGNGAFGVVYAGYWYPRGTTGKKVPVAIKVVSAVGKIKAQEEGGMLDEAAKMAQLRHNHLLRLIGVCFRDEGIELVTLLRPLGNLLNFVRKHKESLMGKHLLLYCYQIASAMKYLEQNKLVHRDLAARNVLVKKIDHVEVTDFGLSKFISFGEQQILIEEGKIPIKWVPPEVWETYTYTSQSDVWSYGVTCWEILTFGLSPYKDMNIMSIKSYLNDGNRLPQPNNCSTRLYQMLLQCWMVCPDSRPSFALLYDQFKEFCKTPNGYILESSGDTSAFCDDDLDQQKELREIMNDECWDDVEDPLNYFDNHGQDTDSLIGQPMSRGNRRLTSNSSNSQRYHGDPMTRPPPLTKSVSMGIDERDNYLIPDSKQYDGVLYTPVVINENGDPELLESPYYNDQKAGTSKDHDYYNDGPQFKKQDSVLRKIQEESEEVEGVEKESCL